MSATPQHLYTLDEYFALELVGDARYEYWDGEIVCMSGGSIEHTRISGSIYFLIRSRLTGKKCEAFTDGQAVETPKRPPYRYPDVTVVCGEPEIKKIRGIDVLVNPTLIVEVMSFTSEERDRKDKLGLYQALPSLKEYVLVAQDKPLVIQYVRRDDDTWATVMTTDPKASVTLSSIDCALNLEDVYRNVRFAG